MGVNNFANFFKPVFANSENERYIREYRGKIVVIDAIQRMTKQCIGRRSKGYEHVGSNGKSNTHIVALFNTVVGLLDFGIHPIFVFDGKPPKEKQNTLINRKIVKLKAQEKCEMIEDKNSKEYIKNFKRSFYFTSDQIKEMKMLLLLMGVKYIESIDEADQQCAALSAYYNIPVITDDTDILVFGGTTIWRNFSLRDKKTLVINRKSILDHCLERANTIRQANNLELFDDFCHDSFVDFCIMLGTDYKCNQQKSKIFGANNIKLFELFVLNNLNIEKTLVYIRENHNDIHVSPNFLDMWKSTKNIYLNSNVYEPKDINLIMSEPKIKDLYNFLCETHKVNREFVLSKMAELYKNYNIFNTVYKNYNKYYNSESFENFRSYQYKYCNDKLKNSKKAMYSTCVNGISYLDKLRGTCTLKKYVDDTFDYSNFIQANMLVPGVVTPC